MAALLSSEQDLKVVAEAGSPEEALRGARTARPAAVVLDFPGHEPVFVSQLHRLLPDSAFVALVEPRSTPPLFAGLIGRLGVAVLSKDIEPHEFCDALRRVVNGEYVIDPTLTAPTPGVLTPRELEVLEMVAYGRRNRQIADRLVLSVRTVETHIRSILAKLAATSRMEAVVNARRAGWL